MTSKTRYFIIVSLLVLTVGLGTGMVAYYVGVTGGGLLGRDGPDELRFVPADAALVAFTNVQDIMTSEVRQKIRRALPMSENGQREFEDLTGVNIETDIDHVVASLRLRTNGGSPAGLVLASGRFNEVKIEALMRDHGAQVQDYKGKRLIVSTAAAPPMGEGITLSFIQPGLLAMGADTMVRSAVDLQSGGDNITSNHELMELVKASEGGNAWAVGRFDALRGNANLPARVASQIPAITLFSISGRVDNSIRAVVRADTRDEEAANSLRDVVRGFVALAKLQGGGRPEFQTLVQSIELGGTGKSVTLSIAVPGEVFDAIGHPQPPTPGQ